MVKEFDDAARPEARRASEPVRPVRLAPHQAHRRAPRRDDAFEFVKGASPRSSPSADATAREGELTDLVKSDMEVFFDKIPKEMSPTARRRRPATRKSSKVESRVDTCD
jgi:hypothetical protein